MGETSGATSASGGGRRSPRRWPLIGIVVAAAVTIVLAAAMTFIVVGGRSAAPQTSVTSLRPTGLPADVSTNLAALMGLSPVQSHDAPGFTLTDQHGRTVALSSLRGRAIVLEFMDPHCVDICPLVSQEFVDAYHDLGAKASKVAFVAVNVNQYYPTPHDMLTFSREHGLVTIPSWRFLTGPTPRLHAVWRDYDVQVEAPNPNADIVHTSIVYFIDSHGVERYVASPMADHTASGKTYLPASQLASWGRGIALVAAHLSRS